MDPISLRSRVCGLMIEIIKIVCVCFAGVAWGCRWDFEENGVWKEVCYCEDRDGCNSSNVFVASVFLIVFTSLLSSAKIVFTHEHFYISGRHTSKDMY